MLQVMLSLARSFSLLLIMLMRNRWDRLYAESVYLSDFRHQIKQKTKGCVVMEDPQWLAEFVMRHQATNTSGRKGDPDRLKVAPEICSHGSCEVIPEKSRIYRFAKRRAFFGLGAYG